MGNTSNTKKGDGYYDREDEDLFSSVNPWYHFNQRPFPLLTSVASSSKITARYILFRIWRTAHSDIIHEKNAPALYYFSLWLRSCCFVVLQSSVFCGFSFSPSTCYWQDATFPIGAVSAWSSVLSGIRYTSGIWPNVNSSAAGRDRLPARRSTSGRNKNKQSRLYRFGRLFSIYFLTTIADTPTSTEVTTAIPTTANWAKWLLGISIGIVTWSTIAITNCLRVPSSLPAITDWPVSANLQHQR